MTIVSSLDYTPTFRERQEYEVMMILEEAIKSGQSVDTHDLAVRIANGLDSLEPFDDEPDDFDANVYANVEKPRVRVKGLSRPHC
jgi:hypothetical protein